MPPKPEFVEPVPAPLSFAQVEKFAEKIAKRHRFDSRTKPVRMFAEAVGGRIELVKLDDYRELEGGSLVVYGPNNFLIRISPITGLLRDNFTIAHELGHYFLHSGSPPGSKCIKVGRWGSGLVEQQANRFAAALLMPEEKFREFWKRSPGKLRLAAALFNVSPVATEVRARALGLA